MPAPLDADRFSFTAYAEEFLQNKQTEFTKVLLLLLLLHLLYIYCFLLLIIFFRSPLRMPCTNLIMLLTTRLLLTSLSVSRYYYFIIIVLIMCYFSFIIGVIMKFMEDYPARLNTQPAGKKKPTQAELAQQIIVKALKQPKLRNEVYCQLMKQTTKNPTLYVSPFLLLLFIIIDFDC